MDFRIIENVFFIHAQFLFSTSIHHNIKEKWEKMTGLKTYMTSLSAQDKTLETFIMELYQGIFRSSNNNIKQ